MSGRGRCHSENRSRLRSKRGDQAFSHSGRLRGAPGRIHFIPKAVHAFLARPKCGSRDFEVLKEREYKILGIVENLKLDEEGDIGELAKGFDVPYLTGIPLYRDLEDKIGKPDELLKTEFAERIREVAEKI